jgi:DNA-binding NarL/FixJ family response regulator
MHLDAQALSQLRSAVRDLDARAASLTGVVQLAGTLQLDTGVTVDFAASRELGQPLVVLRPASAPALPGLTRREREIATLIADGLSNKEIAARLGLTLGTVKHYVHQILEKTGLPSRVSIATRQSLGPAHDSR